MIVKSFVFRQTHLGRSQVQLPTPKFMHHSNTKLRRRTQSVNPRHHMRCSSLRLPKYISISNPNSELLFDASSYLSCVTPTELANRTPIDLLKEPIYFRVLNLGPSFLMPHLPSEEILKEFPSRVIFWYLCRRRGLVLMEFLCLRTETIPYRR